jgi:hypothetical protein
MLDPYQNQIVNGSPLNESENKKQSLKTYRPRKGYIIL